MITMIIGFSWVLSWLSVTGRCPNVEQFRNKMLIVSTEWSGGLAFESHRCHRMVLGDLQCTQSNKEKATSPRYPLKNIQLTNYSADADPWIACAIFVTDRVFSSQLSWKPFHLYGCLIVALSTKLVNVPAADTFVTQPQHKYTQHHLLTNDLKDSLIFESTKLHLDKNPISSSRMLLFRFRNTALTGQQPPANVYRAIQHTSSIIVNRDKPRRTQLNDK